MVSPFTVKRRARPFTSTIFINVSEGFSAMSPTSTVSLVFSEKPITTFVFV